MKIVVGVSDFKVSSNTDETLITYALGSCLGIAAYDPAINVGGLLHVMLPSSKADPEKAARKPAMYVDTGFQLLLNKLYDLGAKKRRLKITVAGGASMKAKGAADYFKIGERNIKVLRKLLLKNRFMVTSQDVGGHKSRTMALQIADGYISINKKPIGAKR